MQKEKKYIVYKHTSPSGKVYIGQTCQSCTKRFGNKGAGYDKSPHFYAAIQKYGWDNIKHEVMAKDLTKAEANWVEKYLIRYYNSDNKEHGYNMTIGGDNNFEGKPSWNKGRAWTAEERKKLSDVSLNRYDISKQVLCVETGVVYPSAAEAGRVLGINSAHIAACRLGRRKTCGGYHWKYVS